MTVRRGERRDCAAVVALAQRAWPETPFAHAPMPDALAMLRSAESFVERPENAAFVLVDDQDTPLGVLTASLYQHPFSGQWLGAQSMWWVDPNARGHALSMLTAAEDWARSHGIQEFHCYAHTEALGKVYRRRGYHPFEVTCRKAL